ncbi:endo-1,4-beta-glucanase [Sorangium cellulosum]|uniref:Endo-1,4-beta-glucanase n=1 Tax=Sorangium cellulosum TaxID=56 RepID=A0A2L0ER43_SORCE|nr:hypothetical protein [Sorangium cellulosum]AUX41769.1 endo-1,4-beta-glucanase [Sorangium cellulosum]
MHTPPSPLGRLALVTAIASTLAGCVELKPPSDTGGGVGGGGGSPPAEGGHGGEGSGGLGGDGGGECIDECPADSGIKVGCKTRFMYGINYAWHHFAGDFGGIAAWGQGGVASEEQTHAESLAAMRAHGASVVRWWMLPEFRGEGVLFDASEDPIGLGERTLIDVEKALELAERADVHLMFCLFSYDAFHPTRVDAGVKIVGLQPIMADPRRRALLMENVVRPLARAVERSPYGHRMAAWDVINEPELAITGQSPYGDPDYIPDNSVQSVTHEQMETFLNDTIRVLRSESSALVTIGSLAMKWSKAWSRTDIDFYTFHIYDWVNQYWPYNQSPADYHVDDKPVVMGVFPIAGLATTPVPDILASWYTQGYAGALSWAYNGATPTELETVKSFADEKACKVKY